MCLVVDRKKHWFLRPKKAKKDIVCYKALMKVCFLDGSVLYVTPYYATYVDIKEPFESATFDTEPGHTMGGSYVISYAIHTFKDIEHIPCSLLRQPACRIFECIIPKGTLYWIGYDGEYASERIEFIKKLD